MNNTEGGTMTIDEAIESLGLKVNNPDIDTRDIQLGVEALERLVWERRYGTLSQSKLLPSETE